MKIKDEDAVEISTKSYSVRELKKNKNLEYGSFVKTAKLTAGGTENLVTTPFVGQEPLKVFQGLTDEELFAACGGRTAHKGARHGLKLSGKLSRIEKQEKLLLRKMKKVSLSDESCSKVEKKLKRLKKQKEECGEKYIPLADVDNLPSTSSSSLKKRNKKRKSVSFNETVTKIYTADADTSFDSEVGSLRDENSNDANNNSGSDEGIEQDLENNNNDLELDNHRAFEEARLNFSDLSKAERNKLKKKRKLDTKNHTATGLFLQSIDVEVLEDEVMQEEKETSSKKSKYLDSFSKKRKYLEETDDMHSKRTQTESPERLKRKKNKKKKRKQKKEEAKVISSITKSLEGFCRISESDWDFLERESSIFVF